MMQSPEKTRCNATPSTAIGLGCLSPAKQDRYTCICCRVKFESVEQQRGHFKTEWHLYNLKRKVCNLDSIDQEGFNKIQEGNIREKDSDETSTILDTSSYIDLGAIDQERQSSDDIRDNNEDEDEEDWEKIESVQFLDEDYTDTEIEELIQRMVSIDTCLFCDCKSSNVNDNIEHMNTIHGFFLPEEQYLIDLEGMMDYLGFKVGAGATCLWCDKQFASLHGVRLHMLYKDHCKIAYDQDRASEYRDYYDYTNQEEITMKPLDELMIKRKSIKHRYSTSPNDKIVTSQTKSHRKQLARLSGQNLIINNVSYKEVKKFNSKRAKILLKTEIANNKTIRGRVRSQNPI